MKFLPIVSHQRSQTKLSTPKQSLHNSVYKNVSLTKSNLYIKAKRLVKQFDRDQCNSQFYEKLFEFLAQMFTFTFQHYQDNEIASRLTKILYGAIYSSDIVQTDDEGNIMCKKLLQKRIQQQHQKLNSEKSGLNKQIQQANAKIQILQQKLNQKLKIQQVKHLNSLRLVQKQQRQRFSKMLLDLEQNKLLKHGKKKSKVLQEQVNKYKSGLTVNSITTELKQQAIQNPRDVKNNQRRQTIIRSSFAPSLHQIQNSPINESKKQ